MQFKTDCLGWCENIGFMYRKAVGEVVAVYYLHYCQIGYDCCES